MAHRRDEDAGGFAMHERSAQLDQARGVSLGSVQASSAKPSSLPRGSVAGASHPGKARRTLGSVTRRPPAREIRPGLEIAPGYRLAEKVGDGPSAEVWRAEGPEGGSSAFKIFWPRETTTPAAGDLSMPAWVRAFHHTHLRASFGDWKVGDRLVVGMEWAEESLRDRLERARRSGLGGLPPEEALGFLEAAARGIDALGDSGCPAHGGLKLENLLLVGGCLKVADGGMAAARGEGPPSPWSDQHALALIYCELLAGQPPEGGDLAMIHPEQRPAVARALAMPPESRWPSCRAFAAALREPSSPVAEGVPKRRWRWIAAAATVPAAIALFLARPFPQPSPAVVSVVDVDTSPPVAPRPAARVPAPPRQALPHPIPTPPRTAPSDLVESSPAVARRSAAGPWSSVLAAPSPPLALDPPALPPVAVNVTRGVDANAEPTSTPPARAAKRYRFPAHMGTTAESSSTPPLKVLDDEGDQPPPLVASAPAQDTPDVEERTLPDPVERAGRDAPPPPPPPPPASEAASPPFATSASVKAATPEIAAPSPVKAASPAIAAPAPGTAIIVVLMPDVRWDLSIRGQVGPSTLDEWSGPRRVIHTPRLVGKTEYTIGAFWGGSSRKVVTRTSKITVTPGETYEIDLRRVVPKSRTITR